MVEKKILIVEDDAYFLKFLQKQISELGQVFTASTYCEAVNVINESSPDIAVIDIDLGEEKTGLDVLDYADSKGIYSVILTDNNSDNLIIEAYRRGCESYLTKGQGELVIKHVIGNYIENTKQDNFLDSMNFYTAHKSLKAEISSLESRLGGLNRPTLVLGENGTGKSKIAKIAHSVSGRESFHKVKLQSSSQEDIRNFLFGNMSNLNKYWYKRFINCTIYFDGIGSMPLAEQEYILSLLKRKDFSELNIQIIASATEEIYTNVHDGLFKPELLRLLSEVIINIPPLRERPEDVPLLIKHILNTRDKSHIKVSDEAMECLKKHMWPSNINELFSTMTTLSNAYREITHDRLPSTIGTSMNLRWHQYSDTKFLSDEQMRFLFKHGLNELMDRVKLEGIKELMKNNNFKTGKALEQSQISKASFFRLVKRSLQELGNYVG